MTGNYVHINHPSCLLKQLSENPSAYKRQLAALKLQKYEMVQEEMPQSLN